MKSPANSDLAHATRDELYEKAKEEGIEGRSSMSKSELQNALNPSLPLASRLEEFEKLAIASAQGAFLLKPRILTGNDRRLHVRQTLREDHQMRILDQSEDAGAKFDKLANSLFSFFRGTALLFYRDMAGDDAWMPTVLTLGDVHPENFGVMPNANNVPFFGINDFDEAYYAPFTWDLRRGTTGFLIAALEEGGYGKKKQQKIARRFIEGYVEGIRSFAEGGQEQSHEMRLDTAPKLIRKLIEDSMEDRAEWLADDYLDESKRGFRASDELVPISDRIKEFQKIINLLIKQNNIDPPRRTAGMRLKDVAIRRGQGTASLGLPRYYCLIEGPLADGTDDVIIELKQARRSALTGLVGPSEHRFDRPGERIAHAQGVQLVQGDVFYGSIDFEGLSFMSRERAPFRNDIDLDELSKSDWKDYAAICGQTLAHAHALSDEFGDIDHDIEPAILQAIGHPDLFVDDILRYATEASERYQRDHEAFKKDHALAAFDEVDLVYR